MTKIRNVANLWFINIANNNITGKEDLKIYSFAKKFTTTGSHAWSSSTASLSLRLILWAIRTSSPTSAPSETAKKLSTWSATSENTLSPTWARIWSFASYVKNSILWDTTTGSIWCISIEFKELKARVKMKMKMKDRKCEA